MLVRWKAIDKLNDIEVVDHSLLTHLEVDDTSTEIESVSRRRR
jgi:hypothetical protein